MSQAVPPDAISRSFLEQKIDSPLPANELFSDDAGQPVHLGDYFGRGPIFLVLGYFTCPDLCPMTFRHLTEELNGIAPIAGRDFQVIVISIDPHDTPAIAAQHKQICLRGYKAPTHAQGWHFLIGQQPAIDAVANAVGFHYTADPAQHRFVHPAGVMVLTPQGRISHYFFGIDASPADVEAALHDAARGRATVVEHPEQQYCVSHDSVLTTRGRRIAWMITIGCILWAGMLFGYVGWKLISERRTRALAVARSPSTSLRTSRRESTRPQHDIGGKEVDP